MVGPGPCNVMWGRGTRDATCYRRSRAAWMRGGVLLGCLDHEPPRRRKEHDSSESSDSHGDVYEADVAARRRLSCQG